MEQREVKFRVWDIYKKVFIPTNVFAVTTSNFSYFATMIDDWEDYKLGEFMYPNMQTLSQYTGLKDKNGNDIYEGDIIKRRFHHNNPPSKRPKQSYIDVNLPVIFSDGSFHADDYKTRMTEYGTTYGMWYRECEVIGNIYQNPELLKT